VELNHHRTGSGEPLLMLHGTSSQWQVWRPLFELLGDDHQLIGVDLPGFGESPTLPDGVEPTPYALTDAVEAFLDSHGLGRPAVIGNSLGGWIALELAKRGRARAVTALSPAGFWTPRERAFAIATLRLDTAVCRAAAPQLAGALHNTALRTLLIASMTGRPWRMPGGEAEGMVRNMGRSPGFEATVDGYSRLTFRDGDAVRVPVTIAWGTRDRLLLPRQAGRVARVIPGARLEWLHGCGHVPLWDDPDRIAQLVRETG